MEVLTTKTQTIEYAIAMPDQTFWCPDLNPKQMDALNDYHRYLLLEGPKYSGKSVASCHKIARHLWETDRAEVAMMARTIKSAKSAGIYIEVCSVIEQWMTQGSYFGGVKRNGEPNWVKPGPNTTDGVSKVPYFIVRNMHGTTSRLSLFNCADDSDVEIAVKGTRFSMVYFGELTNFSDRVVFDATISQLRCLHLPYEAHQWLADCNPDVRGEASWIYQLFFEEKFRPPKTKGEEVFRNDVHSIHFDIADNPKLDPRDVENLKASYAHNQDFYDRYVLGKWTASTLDSHFSDVFLPNIHIVGDANSSDRDNWEMLVPDEHCQELIGSYDPGDINHAAVIFTKRIVNNAVNFDVIDELVFLKTKIGIEDFTYLMLEKMDYWEEYLRREYGTKEIKWRNWSDDSCFNYNSAANSYDALIIRNVSEGRINLLAANKAKGAVRLRVELLRKFLFQKRIFFSAQLFEIQRMLKGLKKGSSNIHFVDPLDKNKHCFDALTYGLMGEAPLDAQNRSRPKVEKRSSVVAVGL